MPHYSDLALLALNFRCPGNVTWLSKPRSATQPRLATCAPWTKSRPPFPSWTYYFGGLLRSWKINLPWFPRCEASLWSWADPRGIRFKRLFRVECAVKFSSSVFVVLGQTSLTLASLLVILSCFSYWRGIEVEHAVEKQYVICNTMCYSIHSCMIKKKSRRCTCNVARNEGRRLEIRG